LAYVSDGDVRRAVNALQAAAALGETVDEDAVYETTATAREEEVEELLEKAVGGEFSEAREILDDLLDVKGISGGDLIDQMHRAATEIDADDAAQVRLMDRIGETDYRISTGGDERIQIEAFLAGLSTDDVR
ncbi:MAG: replication factor C small subunit, partial [Halobacteriales archaeon]